MRIAGDALTITKAEARAILAFAPRDEDAAGVIVQGSELAAEDCERAATLGLEDGGGWQAVPYLVPRDAWESAIRACSAQGVIAVRRGELAVFRSALDADETADATTEERSARALATLEYEPGEATFVRVTRAKGAPCVAWLLNASHLAALALVARAAEGLPAITMTPALGAAQVFVLGGWLCSFAQVEP